jgi:hypothetical protein
MIITATFRGADGSCGYHKNRQYVLDINTVKNNNISIVRKDTFGYCIYSNVITFLDNWTNISKL